MKRFAIISATALLGACANGASIGTIDPKFLTRAACIQQIQLPEHVDLKKLTAEEVLAFHAKIEACLKA